MTSQTSSSTGTSNNRSNKWIVAAMSNDVFSGVVAPTGRITSSGSSSSSSSSQMRIVNLKDPSTKEFRNYVILEQQQQQQLQESTKVGTTNNSAVDSASSTAGDQSPPMTNATMLELQSLPADFSSFFVGRHVVGDGNFYVMNPMDPLFWVLGTQEPDNKEEVTPKRSWQPYHQMMKSLFPTNGSIGSIDLQTTPVLQHDQLPHLFQTLCNEQTDHVTYYKFCPIKALRWLERKQQVLYRCLVQQQQLRRRQTEADQDQNNSSSSEQKDDRLGGSRSATFYLPEEDLDDVPMATETSSSSSSTVSSSTAHKSDSELDSATEKQLKLESFHILSSYLSPTWTKAFLESLPPDMAAVAAASATTGAVSHPVSQQLSTEPTPSTAAVPVTQETTTTKPKPKSKPPPAPRTSLNKSLDKVNKKGMKTMSSFFGVLPAAKKAKTTKPTS